MGQEADDLRRQIAAKRDELDTNIQRLQHNVRSAAWTSMFALVVAFGIGLVLSTTGRRRAY
jgi:hypothetical protein